MCLETDENDMYHIVHLHTGQYLATKTIINEKDQTEVKTQ